MKKYIHVNQHIIKSNHKHNKYDPVLRVKTYKSNDPAYSVVLKYGLKQSLQCGGNLDITYDYRITERRMVFNRRF